MHFPTFCHISEYGPPGYDRLDLMVAASDPLCLWSPSSTELRHHAAPVPVDLFLDYVDCNRVRIAGRRDWLYNGPARQNLATRWEGARWDETVDGRLREFCEGDQDLPAEQRRVTVSGEEDGWEWSSQYLEEHPDEIDFWYSAFCSAKADETIPRGVLENADRVRMTPRAEDRRRPEPYRVASAILRDARNHVQALEFSKAQAPVFLHRADPEFYRMVGRARDENQQPAWAVRAEQDPLSGHADAIVGQLLEVLNRLNDISQGDPLHRFIAGPGHTELAKWSSSICAGLKQVDARRVDGVVVRELREALRRGVFKTPIREIFASPTVQTAGILGFVFAALDVFINGASSYGRASIGLSAVPIVALTLRQMGWLSSPFDGPQWPFLYVYGTAPTKEHLRHLDRVLRRMTG